MRRCLFAGAILLALLGQAMAEEFFYIADHNTGKVIKIKCDGTLVWDAIGAHPPTLSNGYYGHWKYPPEQ